MIASARLRGLGAGAFALLAAALVGPSCNGSTGGELFELEAYAAGPEGAAGGSYDFTTPRGYHVTLTKAVLHIGAVYLNQAVPTSVASDTSCTLPGIYVAEVTEGMDVDVLDPSPQKFPALGSANSERARTGEIWLSGGDLYAENDTTVIASIEGMAEKGGESFPFSARITIGKNRKVPADDPALPGAKPICKERVVSPIAVDLTAEEGGALFLRVDPAGWFGNVEFADLEEKAGIYRFRDDGDDQPSRNLYAGLRANAGVYELSWVSHF